MSEKFITEEQLLALEKVVASCTRVTLTNWVQHTKLEVFSTIGFLFLAHKINNQHKEIIGLHKRISIVEDTFLRGCDGVSGDCKGSTDAKKG